jgi:hypothetical protein
MDFGKKDFEIRILNNKNKKLIVHNMRDFLDAVNDYLKGKVE